VLLYLLDDLSLVQLLCLSIYDVVFSSHVWFVMKWKDNRLKWIPANYENVRQVTTFRNTPPGSRPTYTFSAFRYMYFPGQPSEIYLPGHGLRTSTQPSDICSFRVTAFIIHFFSVQRKPPSAASYRKSSTFKVCRRPAQRGQRLTENHKPS
jgi:hypothetical protein